MEESIKIDGKVLVLSPITAGDFDASKTFIQYLPYYQLEDIKDQFPDKALVQARLAELFTECSKTKISPKEFDEAVTTSIDGVVFLIWCSLKKKHPELTRKDVRSMLPIGDLEDITRKIALVSGWSIEPTDPAAEKKAVESSSI